MAAHGARRLMQMVRNLEHILGVELLCAAQGVEFRAPLETSGPLAAVIKRLRRDIASLADDRYMANDLAQAAALVGTGAVTRAAATELPTLG